MDKIELLSHLETRGEHYAQLARLVAQFLAWKVRQHFGSPQLPVLHKIEHRAKSIDSLKRNLDVGRYEVLSLAEIVDLAGARLIFFFKDDLEGFIREKRSDFVPWFGARAAIRHVEGSKLPDGSRAEVGYESYHLVGCVTRDTDFYRALSKSDQQSLKDLYWEVQLRTVLQHAWAEADHDLRYKVENVSGHPCPRDEARRLLNTAGSIGLADKELASVKQSLSSKFHLGAPRPQDAPAAWRYGPKPDGFKFRRVRYDYHVIHSGPTPPTLQETADIFDVDREMLNLLGISHYKQKMWDMLTREDPQFVAQVDHDSLTTRLATWDEATRTLTVQPAYYSDQAVTNHRQVLDRNIVELNPPRKVRTLATTEDGTLLSFEKSPMSNTLGVACVVRVEGHWVIPRRSKAVAFDSGKLGCSSSGALEWNELGHWSGRDFVSWFAGGMSRELEEELGLKVEPRQFTYLALARELGRVGKPQLFFFLDLDEFSFRTIEARWTTYTRPPVGDSKVEYVDLRPVDDKDAARLMSNSGKEVLSASNGVSVSEELRMNLALAIRHLELSDSEKKLAASTRL